MTAQTPYRSDGQGEAPAPATARQLEVGEKFTIEVIARRYWNNTALHVTAGQRYRLAARGTWVDFYIPCGADGYQAPGWLLRGPWGLPTRFMQVDLVCHDLPHGVWETARQVADVSEFEDEGRIAGGASVPALPRSGRALV